MNNAIKGIYAFIILVSSPQLSQAQFGPQQVISTDALFPRKVAVGDMDGNGTLDVLSAARTTNEIAWYSNETGIGDFGPLRLISESSENNAIIPGDLDGDGDLDIVASSANGDIFFWQENLDGLGNFGPQQLIDTVNGAFDMNLSDIDNDGDLDILGGSFETGILYLYKNNGTGIFETAIEIGTANGRSIITGDLDGDLDLDIIVSNTGNIIIGWYENLDGLGNYSSIQTIGFTDQVTSTISSFATDIDNDGDLDILSASSNENFGIHWFENLDGLGNFSEINIIFTDTNLNRSVFGSDLDNDGDVDALAVSVIDNRVSWYENLDGLGTFGSQQTITTNAVSARHVIAADLDDDGDMDVISASQNDSKIAWYENDPKFVGFVTPSIKNLSLTPNPVTDSLTINNPSQQPLEIEVYSISGKTMIHKSNVTNHVSVTNLTQGIYFIRLSDGNNSVVKKFIKL